MCCRAIFFQQNVRLDPASEAELSRYQVALRIEQGGIMLAQQQHKAGIKAEHNSKKKKKGVNREEHHTLFRRDRRFGVLAEEDVAGLLVCGLHICEWVNCYWYPLLWSVVLQRNQSITFF
jgi:hypothetical protein